MVCIMIQLMLWSARRSPAGPVAASSMRTRHRRALCDSSGTRATARLKPPRRVGSPRALCHGRLLHASEGMPRELRRACDLVCRDLRDRSLVPGSLRRRVLGGVMKRDPLRELADFMNVQNVDLEQLHELSLTHADRTGRLHELVRGDQVAGGQPRDRSRTRRARLRSITLRLVRRGL